jgi:hypothetical protein
VAGVFLRTYLVHYIRFFCTRATISVFIVKPTVFSMELRSFEEHRSRIIIFVVVPPQQPKKNSFCWHHG